MDDTQATRYSLLRWSSEIRRSDYGGFTALGVKVQVPIPRFGLRERGASRFTSRRGAGQARDGRGGRAVRLIDSAEIPFTPLA